MTKTASLIRADLPDFRGSAHLYRLSEPLSGHEYVVVSAAVVPYSGPETYVFAANESGEVTDWMELGGSYRGGLDHDTALTNAGYEVKR